MISRSSFAVLASIAVLLVFGTVEATAAGLKVTERKIAEKKPAYEIEFAYPQVGIAAIDSAIERWIKDDAATFAEFAAEGKPPPDRPYSGEISYEVLRNDGAMFSVLFTYYTYAGGAHPNSNYTSFNFLLPDGASVEIGEIFSNAGIERISRMAIDSLKRQLIEPNCGGDADWIAKGAAAHGTNFENFILLPNELAIYFDAYQVAAYALGPQEVRIPLAQLRAFMRPDPRAPAASFDCAKAGTDIEQAICSTRDLARLDRRVSDKYFDALVWGPDDAARTKLKNEQRAWLTERDTHCRVAAQSMVSCLMTSYQARLKAIENRT